jgi:uncharacterized membrane protein
MQKVSIFAVILLVFLALDAAWLLLAGAAIFKSQLGPILRETPNFWAAGAFYIVYAAAMLILVVNPAYRSGSVATAAWHGAVLGLAAYATFDLTALAIIKGWTTVVAVIDLVWGTLATTVTCVVGFLSMRKLVPHAIGAEK